MSQVICVTGKMAAGKNYVCSQLEQYGWKSVDADRLVHQAINECTDQILAAFKEEAAAAGLVLQKDDGTINRRVLGQLVFSRPELLARQESIVYPKISELAKAFIAENPKTIINATVLFKTPELLSLCQKILFVTAPFLTRLFRARKRDHLPFRQIFRRFAAQRNLLASYRHAAPQTPLYVIKNTGSSLTLPSFLSE